MARTLTIGAAQSGPTSRTESRQDVVKRLVWQMREAHARGCDLVVFTEVALTAFFPHWYMDDSSEIDAYFETEMPNPALNPFLTKPNVWALVSIWVMPNSPLKMGKHAIIIPPF